MERICIYLSQKQKRNYSSTHQSVTAEHGLMGKRWQVCLALEKTNIMLISRRRDLVCSSMTASPSQIMSRRLLGTPPCSLCGCSRGHYTLQWTNASCHEVLPPRLDLLSSVLTEPPGQNTRQSSTLGRTHHKGRC